MPKEFSIEMISKALQKLIDSRRVFHTHFVLNDEGMPLQYYDPTVKPLVKVRKMTDEELEAYKQEGFVRPYNLLSGEPLSRIEIIDTPTQNCMLFEMHHVICDGITLAPNITLRDLPAAMNGDELVEIPFGMYEYAEIEAANLYTDVYERAKKYYAEKFEGLNFTSLTQLPADCTGNSIHEDEYIPVATVDDWCKELGTQSNLLFMAAFGYVCSVVTREQKIVFSTINHGRMDKKLRDAYGMFVKSSPILANVEPELSVIDYIKSFRSELMNTIRYGAYPYNHLCKDLGMTPTIEFGFQGESIQEYSVIKGRKCFAEQLDRGESSSNLTCIVYLRDGQYDIRLTASDAIFSHSQLSVLAKAIKNAVLNMMQQPDALVKTVSVMAGKEKAQVEALHFTAKEEIPWKLYHQPLEENAVKYADRPALIAKDCTLTFSELNKEANRIANALLSRGVKRGDRIVLLLPRRSYAITSMFGVSKVGAAYIPCDPAYPVERISLIVNDSEAQYIITEKNHLSDYPTEKVLDISELMQEVDTENPNQEVSPDDLAYLIYTSGSTGRPKGVMLRHRGITNYLYDHPANVHIHALKTLDVKNFVSITTLSFDMSLKEFAGSIFNGVTSILADEEEIMDASLLAALMERTGAEGINGTCSRIQSYLELPAFCDAISKCKMVWSGGENYPQQLLSSLQSFGVHIFNTYGPTEITVSSNIKDLTKSTSVSVGNPLLNYVEYIVDQHDNELPVGMVGELLIGGPGVAVGYNNLPEMTSERFIEYNGERVYRSGDLARWREDGDVEIIGRIDSQVKLRGFRIELGEVENKAIQFTGVKQAVADVKNIGVMQHLCLYYTADTEIGQDALREFLAEGLTEYMVPTAYMQIERIPLTPNGKADRKSLPAPSLKLEDIVPPATENEQQIYNIISQDLEIKDFGVTNNLISLGLSSLLCMRLSAHLQKEMNIRLTMKEIMDHPTVRQLAELASDPSCAIPADKALKPHEIQKYYPMTDSQRSMYIDCLLNPNSLIYNIPFVVHFTDIDTYKLEDAIRAVVEAHPYIKARLQEVEGDVMQVRDDNAPVLISRERVGIRPDHDKLQSYIHSFDLHNEPLYRFNILEFMDEAYVVADIHHLVGDGSSNYVFARELERAYNGEALQKEEYTAYDRALDEEELINSNRAKEAEDYFETLLPGVDNTIYPHSQQPDNVSKQGVAEIEINAKAIDAFCKQHSLTPNNFFLEVFHQVLYRITRNENTMLYFISNGRSELMLDNFFGVLVKTLPTVETSFRGSMAELVKKMSKQLSDTVQNDFYPFTRLVERYGIRAEIIYNYVVDLNNGVRIGNDKNEAYVLEWDMAKTPLSITMQRAENGNYLSVLEYDTALYSKQDMDMLNSVFRNFAENCIKPEYHEVSRVPLLSSDQQTETMLLARGKQMEYDPLKTFPQMFIEQATATPDNAAVIDEQGTYTYAELNRLSDALAIKLHSIGIDVSEHPFISIMLGYQKEFMVSSIGIEKAGYAYVPLDYDYPNDRLIYMLTDSESKVLITSHTIFDEKNAEGEFDEWISTTGKEAILFIDDFLNTEEANPQTQNVNYSTPDGLAYMIYTSGSTGKPKGVMIPHKAKANFVNFIAMEWHHTAESRICCHSSFSFDASIEDLYPVLIVGGTLYTVPQEARKDLLLLHDFIIDNNITGGCYTTQLGQMLLQMFPDMPLDYLVVGGEKMTATPDCQCRLINTYGPTEFTVDATYYVIKPGKEYSNIPIGRALHNQRAYVVDPVGQLLPNGMPGELCMAGIQSAAGYWHREELTAQKFVDCPFEKGVRMYHTGDLVRYNSDNQLEYLGRIDNQVKLRGFRIELGEIETLIGKYPHIQMESVQVKEICGVQHLVAYYTADTVIDENELQAFLASQLTDYMVPTAYMQLEAMPLTPNGKVNTHQLPQPNVGAEEMIAPRTDTEKVIFELVVELVKHDQFGVNQNLISMGLTSLSAMKLCVSIHNRLDATITVKDLLNDPYIERIAAMIDGQETETAHTLADGELIFDPLFYYYPLTENQRGIFIDWSMNRDALQYNIATVKSWADVDADTLAQALKEVINAHPYLKTRMVYHHGDVCQIVRKEEEPDVSVTVLDYEPDRTFFQSRMRPFDLFTDTLYRLEIYKTPTRTYLFRDFHHIIYDGGSDFFFMSDLAKVLGNEKIAEEKYTAFDRAFDEWKLMQGEKMKEAEAYFDNLLEDSEVASIPYTRTSDSGRGDIYTSVEKETIDNFCKKQGITVSNAFLASFLQVLHKLTRQNDIMITTINNGRSDVRMMGIMGMFVKTIPVVSHYDGTASILKTAYNVQNQFIETQSLDFYPFTKMVERHQVRAEIMYAFEGSFDSSDADKMQDADMSMQLDTVKMPISCDVFPEDDRYSIRIEYDKSLYEEKYIQGIADALAVFVNNAFASKKAIQDIPLVEGDNLKQLLELSYGGTYDYSAYNTWLDMFEAMVAQYPESVAVADDNVKLTYKQLNNLANGIAKRLLDMGVTHDQFVAVMLDRSVFFPASVIGVHKAGAAYVPVDTEYPASRIQHMITDSESKVIITKREVLNLISENVEMQDTTPVFVEDIDLNTQYESVNQSKSEGIAYMIYTSGSTGLPKGVVLHHKGLVNFTNSIMTVGEMEHTDRVAAYRAFSFDAHLDDIYPILSVGGELHLMPSDIRKDLEKIYQFICERNITITGFTTSIAKLMLDTYPDMPLKAITAGGEKLSGVCNDHIKIINLYGPTECVDDTTTFAIAPGENIEQIPIGRPLPNVYTFVMNDGTLIPHGVPGELYIAGAQVGYGYWNLEDKTKAAFVEQDMPGMGMTRMYRTGDLVKYDNNGQLIYLGRIDSQVKLRGYRIEISEIEDVVAYQDGIGLFAAAVASVAGSPHLVLYYSVSEDAEVTEDLLRQSIEASSLPTYMYPEIYMKVDSLPVLPNGKVDRKNLPEPQLPEKFYVAPTSKTEETLCECVSELMNLETVSTEANLISLGLTSLSAMRLSAIIGQKTGARIYTKEIMANPRICDIAALINGQSSVGEESAAEKCYEKQEYYPLTENQRGVYIDWEMNRSALQYNIPDAIRMPGKDAVKLKKALETVVNAHPSLKTVLVMKDNDVMQRRQDDMPAVVKVKTLDFEPSKDFFQNRVRPFDLFNDRLYRLEVYQTPESVYLFMDIHHIIFDGASNLIFMNEVEQAYNGQEIIPESYTAFDRALYEKEYMQSDEFKKSEAYFDSLLSEAEAAVYPHSTEAQGMQNTSARVAASIEGADIDRFCQKHSVTQNSFFLAVLMQTLHRITREQHIAVATIDNGRDTASMMDIMGMFVKTLPVVSSLDFDKGADIAFADIVKQMQEQFIATVGNELYPYTNIVHRYNLRPEIMFGYQGGLNDVKSSADSDDNIDLDLDTTKAPLCIFFTPDREGSYRIDIEYSTAFYIEADVERLLKAIRNYAINAISHPEKLSAISLVDVEEEKALMDLSKGVTLDYDHNKTFPSMVLDWAVKQPSALAVSDKYGELSYQQLEQESAQVAAYLMAQGVNEGEFVGIRLHRQKEFISCILGIQRMGAAYLPIDPEYPEDRIQYMTEDSQAKVVITPETLAIIKAMDSTDGHVCKATIEGLAYMIYTSGSTGRPKGVMLPHRALAAFLAWRLHDLNITEKSRHAQHASFSFDASLDDLLCPLAAGGSVYIMPEEIRKDMDAMSNFIKEHKITAMTMSTQLGMAMINNFDLPLQFIMMGGEKMLPMRKTTTKIINGYGPTEFTVCSSYHFVDQENDVDIPIGRPVPNTSSYICDQFGNLMPQGHSGELCLSGNQIANGYWHLEDLTAQRFIDAPFASNRKMYRTGDLACYNTSGQLEYLGRIDNQVKLRGFRIEMGEIENQARLYPGVNAVAAEVKEVAGGKHLCLYFTADTTIDVADMEATLSQHLTEYMVPEAYMQLDTMPMTPNGKINRKLLPLPELKSGEEYVEPVNEVEQKIALAFADILNLTEPVGALDSFFALGGDSIKSIRLVSSLRGSGIILDVSTVMKEKTVRGIAAVADVSQEINISQEPFCGEVPDSPILKFFWNLDLPEEHHFNQSFMLQAKQRIDISALQLTINAIVTQHDMLRAVVSGNGDERHLIVRPFTELPAIEVLDLQSLEDYVEKANAECEKRQRGIKVSESLFNVTVLQLPTYDVLLLVCHHAIVDAVSWRVILDDLATAYGHAISGSDVALPAKTNNYKEYAEAVMAYRNSHVLEAEIDYWKSVQEKMSSLSMSDGKKHNRSIASVSFTLNAETTDHLLHHVSTKFNTEINDLLMTALGRAHRKVTGESAVSVQFEGHGREDIGSKLATDRTVGWFTSVYPVVIENLSDDLRKDIRSVKEMMHRIPNKGVGYNILRFIDGNTPVELDKNNVAQIGFNYLGEMNSTQSTDDNAQFIKPEELTLCPDFSEQNKFGPAVNINCVVTDGEFIVSMEADTDVLPETNAMAFAEAFIGQLHDMVDWLMVRTEKEVTASDLGETSWTDDEFEKIQENYAKRNVSLQRIYPLSPMQEGILLYHIMNGSGLAYRLVTTYALDTLLTEEQLRYALDRLGAKHEVLRTAIIHRGVDPRQAIVDRPLALEMRDVSKEHNIDKAVHDIHLAEQQRGFDLQYDSLFRVVCVKTSPSTCRLVVSVHHIVVDGWCIELYTADILRYIVEAMNGIISEPDTKNNGIYEQYIRELRSKDMNEAMDYWTNLLKGYTKKSVIPFNEVIPEDKQTDDKLTITISGDDLTMLNNLCSNEQITNNTVMELVWGLTLNAHNYSDDSVFVKVVSGRNCTGQSVENVVGLFINSVPVRVSVKDGESIRQTLQRMQEQASDTNKWDFCPLADIQNRSELGQDLFQSIFAFENYGNGDDKQENTLPFNISHEYSKEESFNDITITAFADADKLTVNIEFDKTKYLMSDMEEVADIIRNILHVVVSNPDIETKKISVLDKKDTLSLVQLGMGPVMNYDKSQTIIDLFRIQASNTPDAPCVVFCDKTLSFREVDNISDALAVTLHTQYGVKPEMAVGVMVDRSELMVIYPLAIMKAGAAYMPLDFHFPTERLAFMCEDAKVKLILSEENRVKEALPDFAGEIILSDILDNIQTPSAEQVAQLPKAAPENMFVILYTSGSTGTPKGVMLEHHNIVNFCHWYNNEFDVTAEDRAVAYANFGFDAHMMDIYPILLAGGSVYIIESQMRMDLMAMNEYMEANKLTIAFMTTQVGYMFATTIENHSLRLLSVGGEKLQPLQKPPFRFYNGYGPTECTLYSTCYNIKEDYNSSLIGRPLANYQLFVVDKNMNLVPRGADGELIVAGEGVGRGYLNRPDVNKEKFVTMEIPYEDGTRTFRAYRTGDLVRWSKSGDIEYIGRLDGQVKLRGLRIELGEIEARVASYPDVIICAVDVKEVAGAQHICCYYQSEVEIDTSLLQAYIAEKLADYMVPTAYMQMSEFPLTQNGKVNKRALPAPSITINTENVEPETHKEQILFNIVSELLHTDNFGVTDDLTKLGLTSLLGIKLIVMAAKQGLEIKLSELMNARTIRGTLDGHMGVVCWLNEFSAQKPVAVVVCGATPYLDMHPYCEALCQDHNVLIFEPLAEHYEIIFNDADINEVVDFYYGMMEAYLDDSGATASVFTGHCFGGELAYRLAVAYEKYSGISAPMVMLDVFWRVKKCENSMSAMMSLIPEDVYEKHKGVLDSYQKAMSMYDNLSRQGEPELYNGEVVLFRALQEEPISSEMASVFEESDSRLSMLWDLNTSDRKMDNGAFWTGYYPQMQVVGVEAHHMSMLHNEFVSEYIKWINERNK